MPRKINSSFLLLSAMVFSSSIMSSVMALLVLEVVRSPLALTSCILSSFLVLVNRCNSDGKGRLRVLLSMEITRLVDNDDGGAKDSTLPMARSAAAPTTNTAMKDLPTKTILPAAGR